jgi:predicted peroxiredoxin
MKDEDSPGEGGKPPGKLAILLWATDPQEPHRCATPFFHAAAAAAMGAEVEVYFTGRSVRLLTRGVADALYAGADGGRSIYDFMRNAAEMGAKFYACSESMSAFQVRTEELVPEFTSFAGATAYMSRVLDPEWRAITY